LKITGRAAVLLTITVIMLVVIPLAAASSFTYSEGENKTFYAHCVNASSGAFFGANANLTVRDESAVVWQVDALENVRSGVWRFSVTNLSVGHCYAFELGCEDEGSWRREWGTICVNQSSTAKLDQDFADFGAVAAIVFGSLLFGLLAFAFAERFPLTMYFFVPMSVLFAFLGLGMALASANRVGASTSVINLLTSGMYAMGVVIFVVVVAAGVGGVKYALFALKDSMKMRVR
jgi:hypothetical protein